MQVSFSGFFLWCVLVSNHIIRLIVDTYKYIYVLCWVFWKKVVLYTTATSISNEPRAFSFQRAGSNTVVAIPHQLPHRHCDLKVFLYNPFIAMWEWNCSTMPCALNNMHRKEAEQKNSYFSISRMICQRQRCVCTVYIYIWLYCGRMRWS